MGLSWRFSGVLAGSDYKGRNTIGNLHFAETTKYMLVVSKPASFSVHQNLFR